LLVYYIILHSIARIFQTLGIDVLFSFVFYKQYIPIALAKDT